MIEIDPEICVGCGLCAKVCPTGAISVIFGKARVYSLKCTGCGRCLEVCRAVAINWSNEKTRRKVPDRPYLRRGRFGSYRFLSRHQTAAGRTYDHESFNELKERLGDVKKNAEGILQRIERL